MLKHKSLFDLLMVLVFTLIAIPDVYSNNGEHPQSNMVITITENGFECASDGSSYDLNITVDGGIAPYSVISNQGTVIDLGGGEFQISQIPAYDIATLEITDANNENLTYVPSQNNCCDQVAIFSPCDDADPCTVNDFQMILQFDGNICVPCAGTYITDPSTCDDNDCSTQDSLNFSTCECIHTVLPPPACDDGDCFNGFEVWNSATCNCVATIPILGCTNPTALNFDPNATCDDGLCLFSCPDPGTCDDGICDNGLETWDAVFCQCIEGMAPAPCVDDGDCTNGFEARNSATCNCDVIPAIFGCTDANSPNFDPNANCSDPALCNCPDLGICDDNDCSTVDSFNTTICLCEYTPISPLVCDDNCQFTIDEYSPTTCSCEHILTAPNCDDNCPATADSFNESTCECENICDNDPCTNGGTYILDANSCNCILDEPTVFGCTCMDNPGYNPNVNCDDGSCDCTPDGCTDQLACNYDPNATTNDGSCIFATSCDIDICTNGGVYSWDDNTCDCILDFVTILGCTNPAAANFNQLANCDDGSCFNNGCMNQDTTFLNLIECDPDLAGITTEIYTNTIGCDSVVITNSFVDTLICEVGTLNFPIFHDENENGVQDPTENFLTFASILVEPINEIYFSNNTNGGFKFLPFGTYTISYNQVNTPLWELTTANASFEVTLDNNNPIANISFGLKPTQLVSDVQILLINTIPRCNQYVTFDMIAINTGTTTVDGTMHFSFLFDSTVEIIDMPDNIESPNIYSWNFSNLKPGTGAKRQIKVLFPGPPNFQIGSSADFLTRVEYTDVNGPGSSSQNHIIPIQCAYDPNDKLVQPAFPENYALIDEKLTYTVRFQNTGNAEAFDVFIEDEIDPNLDLTTFRVISSSHSDVLSTKINNNLVTFEFENIFLPDSTTNFDASQGYVMYSIRPFDDIEENTFIQNTADIFFDFNPAVVTNTTENKMVSTFDADEDGSMIWEDCDDNDAMINPNASEIPNNEIDEDCDGSDLSVAVIALEDNEINIFPNPFMDKLTVTQLNLEQLKFEIINNTGQILQQGQLNATSNNILLNDIPTGIYFLKITDTSTDNYHVEKVVKLK